MINGDSQVLYPPRIVRHGSCKNCCTYRRALQAMLCEDDEQVPQDFVLSDTVDTATQNSPQSEVEMPGLWVGI